jgi:hypothetical protein
MSGNEWYVVSILTGNTSGDHNVVDFVNFMTSHRLYDLQTGVAVPSLPWPDFVCLVTLRDFTGMRR